MEVLKPGPKLSPLGRLLPSALRKAIAARAGGLDLASVVADLFLTYPPDEDGFDAAGTRLVYFLIEKTLCRYFRLKVMGIDNLPSGPSLVIACHGGGMPYDAACLVTSIYRETGRFSRNAAHLFFTKQKTVEQFLTAHSVVIGTQERLELYLRRGEIVVLFPGGAEDMRRPYFTERYRVRPHKGFAPGHGGYIKLALRTGVPIVPTAIVGAEETHCVLTDIPELASLLGTPYFPVVLSPLPLPARIYIRYGRPIKLDYPPEAASEQRLVDRLNEQVRGELQALIDDTVRRRRGVFLSCYDDTPQPELGRKSNGRA